MPNALKSVVKNLDRGFYKSVGKDRTSFATLAQLCAEHGIGPTDEQINAGVKRFLEFAGIGYLQLDAIPDSYRRKIETYVYDTWALSMALGDAGVRVKGAGADRLEKFFATTSSTILFPTYVESQIMLGVLATPILGSLISTETMIDSHVYQSLAFTNVAADQQLKVMGEGASIPSTKITTADRSITLKKFGRMLEATYESLRLQRMNVVSIMLQRIGQRIALDEANEAISVLISGDGNTGSPVVDTDAEVSGTLDYDELVRLFFAFSDGYQMTTAIANSTNLRTILNMAEFKDPQAGFSFQRTGVLPGPMGASWFRWDSTDSTAFSTDRILAVDNRYALEQITEGGIITEADRLIDQQIERTAITKWTGFAKMDYNATQCLDITT